MNEISTLLRAVCSIVIDYWDPVDLLGFCPMDEYEYESNELAEFLSTHHNATVDMIANELYHLIERSFGGVPFRSDIKIRTEIAEIIIFIIETYKDIKESKSVIGCDSGCRLRLFGLPKGFSGTAYSSFANLIDFDILDYFITQDLVDSICKDKSPEISTHPKENQIVYYFSPVEVGGIVQKIQRSPIIHKINYDSFVKWLSIAQKLNGFLVIL